MTASDSKFASLYDRHYGHVYAYCRRRVAFDRVEDAVADVFLVAWRKIDDVPDGERALMWLYRVAYRVVGHVWRSSSRSRKLESKLLSLGLESHPTPDDLLIRAQEEQQVIEAASRLKARDEEVLRLSVWEGLNHRQIASILDISDNAVKQRLHRAKKNLTREFNRLQASRSKSSAAQEGGVW